METITDLLSKEKKNKETLQTEEEYAQSFNRYQELLISGYKVRKIANFEVNEKIYHQQRDLIRFLNKFLSNFGNAKYFHEDQINKICGKYRLKLDKIDYFHGKIENIDYLEDTINKIKTFELFDYRNLFVLSSKESFEGQEKFPTAIFLKFGSYYFLIHQWGEKQFWKRKVWNKVINPLNAFLFGILVHSPFYYWLFNNTDIKKEDYVGIIFLSLITVCIVGFGFFSFLENKLNMRDEDD